MLNRLSIDVIVAITNELEGRDIARLWICGDALLNHRLGRGGGVKKFSQTFDSLFPGTWPSIVRYFASLEEFTVRHSWDEVPEGEWKPRYSDLSKTVVRIRLAHPDDIISFYDALLAGGTPSLLELTNVSSKSSRTMSDEVLHSLMAHLPHIQVLLFDAIFPLQLPPSVWPKSLRRLYVNIFSLGEDPTVLPASLEELKLHSNSSPSLLSIQWPPNLLKFESYYFKLSLEELRYLPRSLTDLKLPNTHFDNSPEFWKALPPQLAHLSLGAFMETKPLIEPLPRTIKDFNRLPAPTFENVKLYPPSLTAILFPYTWHDPKIYELLPTGLRYASLNGAAARDGEDLTWTRLPDTLESIDGLDMRYLDHYALPSCIRNLTVAQADLTDKRLDRLVSSKLDILTLHDCKYDPKALIRCLPKGLTSLSVQHYTTGGLVMMDGETCKLLPKTLRTLTAHPMELTDPKALLHLPVGLEKLDIRSRSYQVGFLGDGVGFLPKLEELSIRVEDLTPGLAPYLFAILPRKLKSFFFLHPKETPLDITDASLEALPPGLLVFSTSSVPALVSGSWLARKPRCLHSVWFGPKLKDLSSYVFPIQPK